MEPTPMRRGASPAEISAFVVFLVSDESSCATGGATPRARYPPTGRISARWWPRCVLKASMYYGTQESNSSHSRYPPLREQMGRHRGRYPDQIPDRVTPPGSR
jgi:hypothetical protein